MNRMTDEITQVWRGLRARPGFAAAVVVARW